MWAPIKRRTAILGVFMAMQILATAQTSRYALDDAALARAVADGEAGRVSISPVIAGQLGRYNPSQLSLSELQKVITDARDVPYLTFISTPYVRAASTAADAKRRYAPMPALDASALNDDGIVVSVAPQLTGSPIQNVVLKHGDAVTLPTKTEFQGVGSRRWGIFHFALSDFERLPLTLVCVGALSNYEQLIAGEDLSPSELTMEQALKNISDQISLAAFNGEQRVREQQVFEEQAWYVGSVNHRITETNDVFMRVAWKVTINNGLNRSQRFNLAVQFLDKDGFVIDTTNSYFQSVAAFEQRTLTGNALISFPGASRVRTVKAVATRY